MHRCTAGKRLASRMQAPHDVPQSTTLDGAHPSARCTATRQGTRPTLYTGWSDSQPRCGVCQRMSGMGRWGPRGHARDAQPYADAIEHATRGRQGAQRRRMSGMVSAVGCPCADACRPRCSRGCLMGLRHSSWAWAAECACGEGDSWLGGSSMAAHAGVRHAARAAHAWPPRNPGASGAAADPAASVAVAAMAAAAAAERAADAAAEEAEAAADTQGAAAPGAEAAG